MKAYCIFFLFVIISVNIGCKKGTQEDRTGDKPPTEKKAVVTTVAGEGTPGFANGTVLSAKFN